MRKKKSNKGKIIGYGVLGIIVIAFIWSAVGGAKYPDIITKKPSLGTTGATVLIEEFGDLECPACGSAHPTMKRIIEEYDEVIEYKFYHFPLTNIHDFAFKAAEAVECANDQGMMYEFIDIAYLNQHSLSKSDLIGYGEELGLDATFSDCVKSGAKAKVVRADIREGTNRTVRRTPSFFVNGKKVPSWEYAKFKNVIENALA